MSEPRIIRTVEELEALDPATMMISPESSLGRTAVYIRAFDQPIKPGEWPFPAVVIATGDQVRAARKELEKPMSEHNLISAEEAREYIDKNDSPTILIKYADETREVETSREIIVTSEEQSRRNSHKFDYRLARTVITQAEQIKRLQAALRMIDDHEQIGFLIEEKYLTKEDME